MVDDNSKKRTDSSNKGDAESLVDCVICKSPINRGAKICLQCKCYQSPLRRFFSGIDIKSLVALVPIVTLAFVFLKDQIVVHKSDLRVVILDCLKDKVRLAVTNIGDRPAILGENATVQMIIDGQADLDLTNLKKDRSSEISTLVKPNETVIMDYIPVTGSGKVEIYSCPPNSKKCGYRFIFKIVPFDYQPYEITTFYAVKDG